MSLKMAMPATQAQQTQRFLLTISEAAVALGCSERHVKRLVAEADKNRRSRWRWGRELIDLAPVGSSRRCIRVNLAAVAPITGDQR